MCMPAGLSLRWQCECFILSLTLPTLSDVPIQPKQFLPSALQDIYELKDQIQDVEGRYMQGLKELKVEGRGLTACLLLFSGSSLASLTLPLLSTVSPSRSFQHHSLVFECSCLHDLPFSSCFDPTHWLWSEMKTLPQFCLAPLCEKKS